MGNGGSSRLGGCEQELLLSWAVWLYSGFSSLGSMAGEVRTPQLTYPLAVALLLPLVTLLSSGSAKGKEHAAQALWYLSVDLPPYHPVADTCRVPSVPRGRC